jgi:hypothetical protein
MYYDKQIFTFFILITYTLTTLTMDVHFQRANEEIIISPTQQAQLNGELLLAGGPYIFYSQAALGIIEDLLAKKAQINAMDVFGLTPLGRAALDGNHEICQLLLDHNADIEAGKFKPLMIAAHKGIDSLCELFLNRGAQIEEVEDPDNSPLTRAIIKGHASTCKFLLEHGAQINAKNTAHETTLTVALRKRGSMVKILIPYILFNPFLSKKQFQASRLRIWTALCVFKRTCPALPKDMRKLILCSSLELKKDAEDAWPFEVTEEQTPFKPVQTVRLLIKTNRLDSAKTIAKIKEHHMKCVIPLMLECMLAAEYDEARTALNPDRLEENFGKAIEHNIKRRLGLPSSTEDTAEPEKPSKCSLQ